MSDLKSRLGIWSSILGPDSNIDRRTCHRIVSMQVLSLSPSRTGTFSMAEAFSILGYTNPYHFSSIFSNIRDCDMWLEALNIKYKKGGKVPKEFFDQLLGHVSATTDTPTMVFWEELIDAYPEAKVVLVQRDEDKWVKSCEGLIHGGYDPMIRYVLRFTDPWFLGRVMAVGYAWYEGWFGTAASEEAIMKNARKAFRAHYAAIREKVPKERLLEYRLGSGWEPLCEFLGKEVPPPGVEFPHRNEAKTLELAFEALAARALKNSLFNIAVVGGVVGVLVVGVRYMFL